MQDIRIEISSAGDINSIATLWLEANDARRERPSSEEDATDIEDLIRSRMREPNATCFVAKDAERVVGLGHQLPAREDDGACLEIVPGLMHLSMIAVEPAYWGRGIGKAIVIRCIDRATELGYDAIQLWTDASNERAQRLYASVGFTPAGREKIDDYGERIQLYHRPLLSRRESEIAALAGRGQSNLEIARELSISHKTVEKHLASAFQKLGISSRRQLRDWC